MNKIGKRLKLVLIVVISAITSFYCYGLITPREAASVGIIGSVDGPTVIYLSSNLKFWKVLPGIGIFIFLLSFVFLISRRKENKNRAR